MIKKHLKKIIIALSILILITGIILFSYPYIRYCFKTEVNNSLLDSLELDTIDNLMIVAHPDDEALWGGYSLLQKDYFVVCLTNGYNDKRASEFYEVMEKSGDIGIILDYPDKIHGERSEWDFCKEDILKDLETIISYKDWATIVTHNEKGEYGHTHHIKTHNFVVDTCDKLSAKAIQYYFGEYYTKASLLEMNSDELPNSLSTDSWLAKYDLISTYMTQSKTLLKLGHMVPFEEFIIRK